MREYEEIKAQYSRAIAPVVEEWSEDGREFSISDGNGRLLARVYQLSDDRDLEAVNHAEMAAMILMEQELDIRTDVDVEERGGR